jgi:hypothetical protein
VRDKTLGNDDERLIPVEHLGESTEKRVKLNFRRDEMARMEPFVKTRYLKLDKKAVKSLPSEPVRRHW